MTGRRISATIVVLITPKKDTLMEIYDYDWTQNFATQVILKKLF